MPETEKEYLVGTVRPTNRPEAGQEIDLDERIPAKIKIRNSDDEFHTGHRGRVQHVDAGLRGEVRRARKDGRAPGPAERRAAVYAARLQRRAGNHQQLGKKIRRSNVYFRVRTMCARYGPWG